MTVLFPSSTMHIIHWPLIKPACNVEQVRKLPRHTTFHLHNDIGVVCACRPQTYSFRLVVLHCTQCTYNKMHPFLRRHTNLFTEQTGRAGMSQRMCIEQFYTHILLHPHSSARLARLRYECLPLPEAQNVVWCHSCGTRERHATSTREFIKTQSFSRLVLCPWRCVLSCGYIL